MALVHDLSTPFESKGGSMQDVEESYRVVAVSQVVNLAMYLACFFGILALDSAVIYLNDYLEPYYEVYHIIIVHVAVISYCTFLYFKVKCEYYRITVNNIVCFKGVFNRDINNIELYRIKDFAISEPLHYRVFGLSNLMIISSDKLSPFLRMDGIRNATKLLNSIRVLVEKERIRLGVREID
jgi:hypothetical protein